MFEFDEDFEDVYWDFDYPEIDDKYPVDEDGKAFDTV